MSSFFTPDAVLKLYAGHTPFHSEWVSVKGVSCESAAYSFAFETGPGIIPLWKLLAGMFRPE